MRRFTILRSRLVSRINELPPTSPPPAAAYPFGFLSPASSSPEVHPAVGVMRLLASSRTVEAAQSHCFSTLRVSKLRASPSPLRGRCRSARVLSPCRLLVRFPLPVLMPPSVSCSMPGLCPSMHLTRSADTLASLAPCRPFADLGFRDDPGPAEPRFFVTMPVCLRIDIVSMPNP